MWGNKISGCQVAATLSSATKRRLLTDLKKLHDEPIPLANAAPCSEHDLTLPETFALHQNYPNPFNPETNISYDLPEDGLVSVNVYDMKGTLVKTLVNDVQSCGYRTLKWNGTNDKGQKVSAGLYLYRIEAEGFTDTKKMALIK